MLGSATPSVESTAGRSTGPTRGSSCPSRPAGDGPDRRGRRPAGRAGRRPPRHDLAAARRRPSPRSTSRPASRPSSSSTGAARRPSCCAGTAVTSRPAPTASDRSSTTRPARRCAATTAAGRRRWRRAARACASPRIRYLGGGTERVEREVRAAHPEAAGRSARPRRGRTPRRRGPGHRRVQRRRDGRPRRDEPRGEGPGRAVGRRSSGSCRPTSPSTCPTSGPRSGHTSCCARPSAGPAGASDPAGRSCRPTSPSTRPSRRSGATTPPRFYDAELDLRRRFGSPPFGSTIKLTVALRRPGRRGARRGRHGRPAARAGAASSVCRWTSPVRRRPTSPAATTAGGSTWSCAATDPLAVLGEDPGPPWSVDVDPESLLLAGASAATSSATAIGDGDAAGLALDVLEPCQLVGIELDRVQALGGERPVVDRAPARRLEHEDDGRLERALGLVEQRELFRRRDRRGSTADRPWCNLRGDDTTRSTSSSACHRARVRGTMADTTRRTPR